MKRPDYNRPWSNTAALGQLAIEAWQRSPNRFGTPTTSSVVATTRKTQALRLNLDSTCTASIIAKLRPSSSAARETLLAQKVLSVCPVRTPKLFDVQPTESAYTWLFYEDLGDEKYDSSSKEQRQLLATRLSSIHFSTPPEHYRECVKFSDTAIHFELAAQLRSKLRRLRELNNLNDEKVGIIRQLEGYIEGMLRVRLDLPNSISFQPLGFAHCDLVPKNLRILHENGQLEIGFLDWGEAAYGPISLDLAQSDYRQFAASPDLSTYRRCLAELGIIVDPADLALLSSYGNMIRAARAVDWRLWSLTTESEEFDDMRFYSSVIEESVAALRAGR